MGGAAQDQPQRQQTAQRFGQRRWRPADQGFRQTIGDVIDEGGFARSGIAHQHQATRRRLGDGLQQGSSLAAFAPRQSQSPAFRCLIFNARRRHHVQVGVDLDQRDFAFRTRLGEPGIDDTQGQPATFLGERAVVAAGQFIRGDLIDRNGDLVAVAGDHNHTVGISSDDDGAVSADLATVVPTHEFTAARGDAAADVGSTAGVDQGAQLGFQFCFLLVAQHITQDGPECFQTPELFAKLRDLPFWFVHGAVLDKRPASGP